MISNNLKVLRAYILGMAISLIVSLAIGALYKYSYIAPTILTSLITICLLYRTMWKMGQQDAEQGSAYPAKALVSTTYFVCISMLFEVIVAICSLVQAQALCGMFTRAGIIWFYPFAGFYHEPAFLVITPIITVITVVCCLVSYIMGTKGISILKTIKNRLD